MGIITAAVIGSICKELAKLLVNAATDSKAASAIAGELAGAAGKSLAEKIIPRLVTAYLGPIEDHSEFRNMPDNGREAVRIEVLESLKPAMDRVFLAPIPYNVARTVRDLMKERGHNGLPVGFSADEIQLYQQALDASVRAVIKVAESAPEWHSANAAEMHAKLEDIAECLAAEAKIQAQVLSVLDVVRQSVVDLNDKEFRDRRNFLEVYYRAICKTLDRMELYGLDVQEDNPARSQRLSVAYISLNLTAKDPGKDEGSRSWESVLDTLVPGAKGRLLVRGDAGMGKTTLLRWAAIALAARRDESGWQRQMGGALQPAQVFTREDYRRHAEQWPAVEYLNPWRGKVPLFIILRECPEGKLPDPDAFPAFVSNTVGIPPAGFVRWLLNEGKALVMIDGLDEVPTGEPTKQTSKGIADLLSVYGERGNLFIATSRPLVKDPTWITQLKFREAVIAPMTDPERDALIHKWHDAVAAETPDQARRAEIKAMPADLIRQLNGRPSIARLATVPLLCAMVCAQSGPLGSKLPESEFAIINKLAEAMLWVRDRDRAVPKSGTPWDDLAEDKRLAVVAKLAHFLISQEKAAVPRADALQKITDALRFAGRSEADAKRDAPAILDRMGDRGGVVRAPEGGLVEFAHKTFCEFLSAFQFVEDQDTLFLGDHAPEPGPSNVCRFAAGVKNRKYTEELIHRVLDGTDSPEARGVIALRMKLAAPTLDPKVQARVNGVEANMIPPHSPAEAKAIAELGDEIVNRLVFTPGMAVQQQIMNATALSQIRSEKAAAALACFAPTADNLTLIELLSRAVNPLTIPVVCRALTGRDNEFEPSLSMAILAQITDATITEWLGTSTELATLTTLYLQGTQVTDIGVGALAAKDSGLSALTSLSLSHTRVTDAGVMALAAKDSGLTALNSLHLSGTRITNAGAAALASKDSGLSALTSLSLGDVPFSDAGVAALAAKDSGLSALTSLYLGGTAITDAGVAALTIRDSGLTALTSLYLSGTKVTDAGVAAIAAKDSGLATLTMLHLYGDNFSDAGVAALAAKDTSLTALTTLNLCRAKVTNAGVAALAAKDSGLTALTSLVLSNTQITDTGLLEISTSQGSLKHLKELYIGHTSVSDDGISQAFGPNCSLSSLEVLSIAATKTTDAVAEALSSSSCGLVSLKTLFLGNAESYRWGSMGWGPGHTITDAAIRSLAQPGSRLSSLTALDLEGSRITDAGVAALVAKDTGLAALTSISLIRTKVTDSAVEAVKARFPGIEVLR